MIGRWEIHRSIDCDGRCASFSLIRERSEVLRWTRMMEMQSELPRVTALLLPGRYIPLTKDGVAEQIVLSVISGGWHVRERSLADYSVSLSDYTAQSSATAQNTISSQAETSPAANLSTTPKPAVASASAPSEPGTVQDTSTDQAAMAQVLIAASEGGVPFCEICQKQQMQATA